MKRQISIIICTNNRAAHLEATLAAIEKVCLPEETQAELIIVDNASTDQTAQVSANYRLPNIPVRYLYEPRRGQCFARNSGLQKARGEIIVFIDDDIRPSLHWLENLCDPLFSSKAHAVVGGVTIAPHLERPGSPGGSWIRLACTDAIDNDKPDLIGANMAFRREVLEKVPCFDNELGPGALGFGDDTLFGWQLTQAGFSICYAPNASVEHYFEPARLTRSSLTAMAAKQGRSSAYLAYHWQHEAEQQACLFLAKRSLRLACLRQTHREAIRQCTEAPQWELNILRDIAYYRQFLKDQKSQRNYDQFGLSKRGINQ